MRPSKQIDHTRGGGTVLGFFKNAWARCEINRSPGTTEWDYIKWKCDRTQFLCMDGAEMVKESMRQAEDALGYVTNEMTDDACLLATIFFEELEKDGWKSTAAKGSG